MSDSHASAAKRFTVKDGRVLKVIDLENVDFFEVDGKYLKVSVGNKKYLIRSSLKAVAEILPSQFIQVHGSYIVNVDSISSIDLARKTIFIGENSIGFSRNHRSDILQVFSLF